MLLSSPGIGSGLDVRGIIENLMSVERRPVIALETRNVEIKAKVSAYGSLKSAVSTFRDAVDKLSEPGKFKVFAATSSDTDVATATASSSAARGVYNMTVNRIAENHRMASGTSFVNADVLTLGDVGDTMTIKVGAAAFVVESGGKTLNALRDEINAAATNSGVTASVMKADGGYRLLLSSNDTGSAKALTVTYSNATDPLALTTLNADRDGTAGFLPADLDASVLLEGQFAITSSSNTLSEAIQGVSVTLRKAGSLTVNVDRDKAAVERSVQDFAKAYSDLVGTMGKMRGQVLKSDSPVLLNLETQMRAVLNSVSRADAGFANVFELGISTTKSGTLEVNGKTLSSALDANFDGVSKLFADSTHGIAKQLESLADSFLATGGPLDGRTQGLDTELRQNDARKVQLEERLRQIELRYTQQFQSLDLLVSQLSQTGQALQQQLAGLSGQQSA